MDNKERIERFIKRYSWNDKDACQKLVLRHIAAGNKIGNTIREFELSTSLTPEDVEAMANEIQLSSSDDATGLGGNIQKYALLVYKEKKDDPISRLIFASAIDTVDTEFGDTLDSEPPTTKGIVTQLMRHNEAIMKTHSMSIATVLTAQQRTINRQSEQLEMLTGKHFETVELIEELTSGKHTRELEEKRLDLKLDMQKQAFGNVKMLMPAIINKIAKRKIMKEDVTPPMMLLKQFADSIKPEQFSKLLESLGPEQKVAFQELYMSLNDIDIGEHGEDKKKQGA